MSLTWAKIRNLYLESTQNAPQARQEWETHLTEGYRRVASELDVAELKQPEASGTVKADAANPGPPQVYLDYLDLDCDVYAIDHIVNITEGFLMYQEPAGMAGRARYIEKTTGTYGMPPKGQVTHWVRAGNRIMVRDRPRDGVETRVQVFFKIQVPEIDGSVLNDHPITPSQYDMAIVHRAAESFFLTHGAANKPMSDGQPVPSYMHEKAADAILARSASPKVEEDRMRYERVRLRGYLVRGGRRR